MPLPPAKEVVADIEVGASGLFKLWLRITRILDVQDKHAKLIENQATQIAALRDAVHTLQARGRIAGAGRNRCGAGGQHLSD